MTQIIDFFKRAYQFVRHDVWRITESELTRGKLWLYRIVKTVVLAIRGFSNNELTIKASALSYSLMFAIIPIIALVLAIAKGFGFEQTIEDWLMGSYVGSTNMVPTMMEFVERYLETAQGGVFLGVGIVILLWSIYSFFQQAESSFNSIWQVKKSRSFARQFTTYFSILFLIPVLIVLSSGIAIYFNSTMAQVSSYAVFDPVVKVFVKCVPYVISWIIFTLLYLVIPNTRVQFWSAATAGIIAGTAFQVFQMLYIMGQVYLSRYNVVYGTFAAIPLLLMWIQISCLIILLGAEISFTVQNLQNFDYEVDSKNISRRYRDYLAVYICYLVIKRFEREEPPLSAKELAYQNHLPIRLVTQILRQLVDIKVLVEVFTQGNENKTYQPFLDINTISIGTVYGRIDAHGSEHFLNCKVPEMELFWEKMQEVKGVFMESAKDLLVKDLMSTK